MSEDEMKMPSDNETPLHKRPVGEDDDKTPDPDVIKARLIMMQLRAAYAGDAQAHSVDVLVRALRAERLKAAQPKWTKEPPTKPGCYWARQKRASGPANNLPPIVPQMVEVTEWDAASLVAWTAGCDAQAPLSDFDLWFGPLEAPPLPEDESASDE